MATEPTSEYLVISRGQWDPALSRDEIQGAIDRFYTWIEGMVADGKMKRGQRLADEGKTVTRSMKVNVAPQKRATVRFR